MVLQMRRFAFGIFATTGLGVLAIVWEQVVTPLLEMAQTGDHQGVFSGVAGQLESIGPMLIAGLLLFVWVYILIAPAQRERARQRRLR